MTTPAPPKQKNYFVCHVRGPDFERLRRLGFLVLYPTLDDYVFLEAQPENLKHLKKQAEYGISFVKNRGALATVTQAEIDRMTAVTINLIELGTQVEVISGYCENLFGVVTELGEKEVRCELKGYERVFDRWVDRLDLVKQKPKPDGTLPDS